MDFSKATTAALLAELTKRLNDEEHVFWTALFTFLHKRERTTPGEILGCSALRGLFPDRWCSPSTGQPNYKAIRGLKKLHGLRCEVDGVLHSIDWRAQSGIGLVFYVAPVAPVAPLTDPNSSRGG